MKEERILITGCGGMLGEAVYKVFSNACPNVLATDIDLNEDWLKRLDVRSIKECERVFEEFKPTLVLHLAALTDLEYCEKNQEDCWKTNALGTENIALLTKKYDITMVYISTAGVFGGEKESFNDFDSPTPLSYYAKAKYYGECFVQQHLSKYYIFRAGWMMGGGIKKDKKFIKIIFNQIKQGKKELFVVDDKFGTPTYTKNFAESILKIIPTGYYGLYNQVCGGSCSRFDVAEEFVRLLGLSEEIKLTKVSSDYFKESYFAPRPFSEKLVNLKLESREINFMKHWKECLEEYSQEFKNNL
jgi:dTDP-4-dehydrorhamnose reductase